MGKSRDSHFPHTERDEKHQNIRLALDSMQVPSVGVQDAPVRCYRLNNEWAKLVMGWVTYLTDTRGWAGALDETHPGVVGVSDFLVGEDCDMLDCADVEDCLSISQTIDNITNVTYSGMLANTQQHLDDLTAAYDGTPQSVGSSIPTTPARDDSLDDNALCSALTAWANVYAHQKEIELSAGGAIAEFWRDMLNAMRIGYSFVPNRLWMLLGDALYGCPVDTQQALAALANTNAIEEFGCCLRDELRDVSMSEAAWNTALSNCAASLTGDAGVIACLAAGDNSQEIALSFFEIYSHWLEEQADGLSFDCLCAPDGWFWQSVDFDWSHPNSGGSFSSPTFTHTNPSNGQLYAIVAHVTSDNCTKVNYRPVDTALPDALVAVNPNLRRCGLHLWEDADLGVFEGADAVDWPAASRQNVEYNTNKRNPHETWTLQWAYGADQGHTASIAIGGVRLLYKEV